MKKISQVSYVHFKNYLSFISLSILSLIWIFKWIDYGSIHSNMDNTDMYLFGASLFVFASGFELSRKMNVQILRKISNILTSTILMTGYYFVFRYIYDSQLLFSNTGSVIIKGFAILAFTFVTGNVVSNTLKKVVNKFVEQQA